MNKSELKALWNVLSTAEVLKGCNGKIVSKGAVPHNYHVWVDGREAVGIISVTKNARTLELVFSSWRQDNEDWYFIVYPETRTGPILEVRECIVLANRKRSLQWKYKPTKQDGQNSKRKSLFEARYGSTTVLLPFPEERSAAEDFVGQVFELAQARIKADALERVASRSPVQPKFPAQPRAPKKPTAPKTLKPPQPPEPAEPPVRDPLLLALDGLKEVLLKSGAPDCETGYELASGDGEILGSAELAWPPLKVGVLLPEQSSCKGVFEEKGWRIFDVAQATANPQSILASLLPAAKKTIMISTEFLKSFTQVGEKDRGNIIEAIEMLKDDPDADGVEYQLIAEVEGLEHVRVQAMPGVSFYASHEPGSEVYVLGGF